MEGEVVEEEFSLSRIEAVSPVKTDQGLEITARFILPEESGRYLIWWKSVSSFSFEPCEDLVFLHLSNTGISDLNIDQEYWYKLTLESLNEVAITNHHGVFLFNF